MLEILHGTIIGTIPKSKDHVSISVLTKPDELHFNFQSLKQKNDLKKYLVTDMILVYVISLVSSGALHIVSLIRYKTKTKNKNMKNNTC